MKIILTLLMFLPVFNTYSQDSINISGKNYKIQKFNARTFYVINGDTTDIIVEKMPVFPGGYTELAKFINDNLNYPKQAWKDKIEGKVFVKFVIKSDGIVDSVHIEKGIRADLDNEAIRVVKILPKWKPGIKNNEPVNVWFLLPINFER